VPQPGALVPWRALESGVYAGRCEGDGAGARCLFRAAIDGTARAPLGVLPGDACLLVPSPDGARLAVASRAASTPDRVDDACSELTVYTPGVPSAPVVVTRFDARDDRTFRYNGIASIAWSPDGARLAVLSDHADGCSGSEGVSLCRYTEYVVDAASPGHRSISTYTHERAALVWLPR
jgi:hypothetical protein